MRWKWISDSRTRELWKEVDELTEELKVVSSLAKFRDKGQMRVVCMDPGGNESVEIGRAHV